MRPALALAVTGLLFAVGCGPNCQSTCQRIYSNGVNDAGQEDCSIQRPGRTQGDLIDTCMDNCENALDVPGELGTYDPYTRTSSNQSVQLDNDQQAAIWMECVEQTDCERMGTGYCAPIW